MIKSAILATTTALFLSGAALAQQQSGLVNVQIVDVANNNNVIAVVQVPVGIAAQVCADVDANVIATQFVGTENIVCDISQEVAAENNIGDQSQGNGQGGGQGGGQGAMKKSGG